MARQPRLDLPGVAQHVIQRGNDRQPCFAADLDYRNYLQELGEAAQRFGCALHAYVLMTNHVHLLVTPAEVGAADDARLTPHPAWLALGRDPSERRTAYRALFDTALPDADVAELRLHTRQQRAWGNPRFQAQIERLTGRSVAARPRGRPPAKDKKGPGK